MKRSALLSSFALTLSLALLSGCASKAPEPTFATVESIVELPAHVNGQLNFDLASGLYTCDMGLSVTVSRQAADGRQIDIGWNGGQYRLDRDESFSGLPRFEDVSSGLVWIDLPWKGVLLDGKTHKPLANECKTA